MTGSIWAVIDLVDDAPTSLALELVSQARSLAAALATSARAVAFGSSEGAVAPLVDRGVEVLLLDGGPATASASPAVKAFALSLLLRDETPAVILVGATPWGRELAGALQGLADVAVLANAEEIQLLDGSIGAVSSAFGGRMRMVSSPHAETAVILVRPGSTAGTRPMASDS